MTRPAVSVVMPFAGTPAAARRAAASLLALDRRAGDELILADNSGTAAALPEVVKVVRARGERSPAHARNAGAEHAARDWILFLDADCRPRSGLLDAYFAAGADPDVGALAGGVVPVPDARTLAARYGTARNFLSQDAHLAHPFRPRAVAANLLVRRAAFAALGGFYEGLRAAEDTDFSWRLQAAGWRLDARPEAQVEHEYRASVAELRRQWRGYAAGRAWLARRYDGFTPEPAVVRAARRAMGQGAPGAGGRATGAAPAAPPRAAPGRDASPAFLALDVLLALEELVGFTLSNRPPRDPARPSASLVLVADRFPLPGGNAASLPDGARVEAARRPEVLDPHAARAVPVNYREDDGIAARAWALAQLFVRHPLRVARGLVEKRDYMSRFSTSLAPAALRLARDPGARVAALEPEAEAQATARRLATLTGRAAP